MYFSYKTMELQRWQLNRDHLLRKLKLKICRKIILAFDSFVSASSNCNSFSLLKLKTTKKKQKQNKKFFGFQYRWAWSWVSNVMWIVWVFGSLLETASQFSTVPYGFKSGSMSSKWACNGIPLITIFVEGRLWTMKMKKNV